jgi:hypothetical protein
LGGSLKEGRFSILAYPPEFLNIRIRRDYNFYLDKHFRYPIDERLDDSEGSDIEAKELDDYLTKRLERIEETKKQKKKEKEIKIEQFSKHKKPKTRMVIDEDSEFEYILESEEEEDEWDSESECPVEKIFSNSFIQENDPSLHWNNQLELAERRSIKPFELMQKTTKTDKGTIHQLHARKTNFLNGGKIKKVEERKEESYIHPALDNTNAFSNISAIFGQHNLTNNNNMLSFQEDSFTKEYEELEFENDLSELWNNSENKNKRKKHKKKATGSMLQSVSDGEYREMQMDNNVQYLKNDMDRITKDLERIRDLVMKVPENKKALEEIYDEAKNLSSEKKRLPHDSEEEDEEEDELRKYQDLDSDDYELPEYNSREISDLINNKVALGRRFKQKDLDQDDDSESD